MSLSRRNFLKSSAGGAVGVTLAGVAMKSAQATTLADGVVWTDKMPINPDIDNMRVICMHDPKMYGIPEGNTMSAIEKVVNRDVLNANMDTMAMELTGKSSAEAAWKTIFRSGKPWKDTKVMIKLNTVEKIMLARVSVIKKIADVLIGFGVVPENIVLFDGQGGAYAQYTNFVSLTDATKIRGVLSNKMDSMGGRANATIPNVTGSGCSKDLIDGKTDIIVNIAINKGHNSPSFGVGLTTLCLKNHYGTFLASNGMATNLHNTNALININKIAPIVGGNPVRQQLCIIDSIWASKSGPGAPDARFDNTPEGKPDRLIMGTFAGAVDYCCVKKIREAIQKVTHDNNIPKFLTEFGYKETDPVWVEITPTGTTIEKVHPASPGATISFRMSNPAYRQSIVRFSLPEALSAAVSVTVYSLNGSQIAQINHSPHSPEVVWDGVTSNGQMVNIGTYIVEVRTGTYKAAERFTVAR